METGGGDINGETNMAAKAVNVDNGRESQDACEQNKNKMANIQIMGERGKWREGRRERRVEGNENV